jgi:hypothetical protein
MAMIVGYNVILGKMGGTNVRDEMFFMRACVQRRRRWIGLVYSIYCYIARNRRKEPA